MCEVEGGGGGGGEEKEEGRVRVDKKYVINY